MVERLHRGLGTFLWRLLLFSIVALAIYVTGMRGLLDTLPGYREVIIAQLSDTLGTPINVESVSGDLDGFTPQLALTGLTVEGVEDTRTLLDIDLAEVRLDPWASVLARAPRLDSIQLRGANLSLSTSLDSGQGSSSDPQILIDLFSSFRRISVIDSVLSLEGANTQSVSVPLRFELRRDGSRRRFNLRMGEPGNNVLTLYGDGVGELFEPQRFAGEIYGHLSAPKLSELTAAFDLPLEGEAELDVWYRPEAGVPVVTVRGRLEALSLHRDGLTTLALGQMVTTAQWRASELGWRLALQETELRQGEERLVIERAQLLRRGDNLQVASADIDVADAVALLLASGALPRPAHDVVQTLSPSGRVTALLASTVDISDPLSAWSARVSVDDATTLPYEGVPGLYGIDAVVEASEQGAMAYIDTKGFGLDLPRVYDQPIELPVVRGTLAARWREDALFLESGVLTGSAIDHDATVLFGIDIPFTDEASDIDPLSMQLSVGVKEVPVAARSRYVPTLLDPNLYQWLSDAIPAGTVEQGVFLWRGGFEDFGGGGQSLQLGLTLEDVALQFQPDWPEVQDLQATLSMNTSRISVWADAGQTAELSLQSVSAEIETRGLSPMLLVQGQFQGGVVDGLNLLRQSPVYALAPELLDDLSADGSISGALDLALDLNALDQAPNVAVRTDITGATVASDTLALTLTDVQGGLDYSSTGGFSGRNVVCRLFGAPVDVDIGAGTTGMADAGVFDARFSSNVDAIAAVDWIQQLAGNDTHLSSSKWPVAGRTPVAVDIAVGSEAHVRVRSTLEGLIIDLPSPVGKTAGVSAPFSIDFDIAPDADWRVFWYGRGQARLHRYGHEFVGANVDVTPHTHPTTLLEAPLSAMIHIGGTVPYLPLEPWLAVLPAFEELSPAADARVPVSIDALTVTSLALGGVELGPLQFDLTPYDGWDMLGVNAHWLDAELTLQHNDERSSLIFNTLDFDALPSALEPRTSEATALAEAATPSSFSPEPPDLNSPITVVIANLVYGGEAVGAVTFNLNSDEGRLTASDIRGNLAGIDFREGSEFVWQRSEQGEFASTLQTVAGVDDIGRTFRILGLDPTMESRSGNLQAQLGWPGGPADIDLLALSGSVDLTLKEGSFLPVPSGATGFMRIVGVLNLAGLFQRANVTRLFEPGVGFREARGQLLFEPGQIEIPSFIVEGAGGGFNFDSDIDLINETIDGELVVTLPLAQNIPWVAALAGGLPVAAGAYLVSKVFEDQVKSLSSGVYSVSGPVAQPEVRFERVFDATSAKVRDRERDQESSAEPVPGSDDGSTAPPPAASSSSRR